MGTRGTRGSRTTVTCVLLLLSSALALAACEGSYEDPDAWRVPFKGSLGSYLQPFKGGPDVEVYKPHNGSVKPQGYVTGRLVLVEGKSLSNWNTILPGSLRATAPADVGTVVVIEQSWHKVGKYSGGEPALQDVWKITVADLARGKVVGRALLRGDDPPVVADVSAGENYGPPPSDELLAYLKKLPRR